METQGSKLEEGVKTVSSITDTSEEDAALVKSVTFHYEVELAYELPPQVPSSQGWSCHNKACANRETKDHRFGLCARCGGARYCGRKCQVADYRQGHKALCSRAADLVKRQTFNKEATLVRLLRKVRLYVGPFVVAQSDSRGEGFLLVQSSRPLLDFVLLEASVDYRTGEPYSRELLMTYMTSDEFSGSMAKSDPRLQAVVPLLSQALGSVNREVDMVVMAKFRCGHLCVLEMPFVPGKQVLAVLATEYGYGTMDTLQLNVDESM